jgi:hypothetical protein
MPPFAGLGLLAFLSTTNEIVVCERRAVMKICNALQGNKKSKRSRVCVTYAISTDTRAGPQLGSSDGKTCFDVLKAGIHCSK